jgi:hypothetical protein
LWFLIFGAAGVLIQLGYIQMSYFSFIPYNLTPPPLGIYTVTGPLYFIALVFLCALIVVYCFVCAFGRANHRNKRQVQRMQRYLVSVRAKRVGRVITILDSVGSLWS